MLTPKLADTSARLLKMGYITEQLIEIFQRRVKTFGWFLHHSGAFAVNGLSWV